MASKPVLVYNLVDDIYMPDIVLFKIMCIFYCDIGAGRDNNNYIMCITINIHRIQT